MTDSTSPRDPLGDFAEDLGRMLGTAQSKATAWLDQRKSILQQLTHVRDTAQTLIGQLLAATQTAVARRRGRPAGAKRGRRGRPRKDASAPKAKAAKAAKTKAKRTRKPMSDEARAKIAEAQRQRWAKQKADAGV
jgi:hypothetical protein